MNIIAQTEDNRLITTQDEEVQHIALDQIKANPYQPRKTFDDTKLDDLAGTLKDINKGQVRLLDNVAIAAAPVKRLSANLLFEKIERPIKALASLFAGIYAVESLSEWCAREGVPAVTGVDTRAIVTYLREQGSSLARITIGDEYDQDQDEDFVDPEQINLVQAIADLLPIPDFAQESHKWKPTGDRHLVLEIALHGAHEEHCAHDKIVPRGGGEGRHDPFSQAGIIDVLRNQMGHLLGQSSKVGYI